MVDFKETEMRKMCRNPKCRSKLLTPVSNEREAFCCRGCYQSFYLHRCIVCEDKIERTTANRKICKKSKCRNALAAGEGFGWYHANSAKPSHVPKNLEPMLETAAAQQVLSASDTPGRAKRLPRFGVERAIKANRARIVGPQRVLNAEIGASSGREVVSPDGVVCYVIREKKPEQTLQRAA
jgi:hypothetical protein